VILSPPGHRFGSCSTTILITTGLPVQTNQQVTIHSVQRQLRQSRAPTLVRQFYSRWTSHRVDLWRVFGLHSAGPLVIGKHVLDLGAAPAVALLVFIRLGQFASAI
jgi:hypothetical protein